MRKLALYGSTILFVLGAIYDQMVVGILGSIYLHIAYTNSLLEKMVKK